MANRDLTPWSGSRGLAPFGRDPFSSFRREMDRLFNEFFAPIERQGFGIRDRPNRCRQEAGAESDHDERHHRMAYNGPDKC